MEDEVLIAKIAYTRLMPVKDWRYKYKGSYYAAYADKALRPNDMQYINSMIGFFICFILMVLFMMAMVEDAKLGFIMCLPMFYITILFLIASTIVHQSRSFSNKELVYWILINVVYFGFGLAFFIVEYEVSEFTIDVTKSS